MEKVLSVSTGFIKRVCEVLVNDGVSIEEAAHRADIKVTDLESLTTKLPHQSILSLWKAGAELSGNPLIALKMGHPSYALTFKPALYILIGSPNLLQGFEEILQYIQTYGEHLRTEVKIIDQQVYAKLRLVKEDDKMDTSYSMESIVSIFNTLLNWASPCNIRPKSISFTHEAKAPVDQYSQMLGCPVYFNTEETVMVFDKEDLQISNPCSDEFQLEHWRNIALQGVQSARENDLYLLVKTLIKQRLHNHKLGIDEIAYLMSMTTRKLQRRLKDEGYTFRDILEQTRKEMSQDYLEEGYSIDKISLLLGYKEPINFIRAYKLWFGNVPEEQQVSH